MLRVDRLCVYVIMFGLILMIPSIQLTKFIDELCVMIFGTIAVVDCIFNGNWRKYRLLWILMAIMTFYAIYSLTFVHNNVTAAILTDWIIELKPFVPFCVLFAVAPTLTELDKKIIKKVCIFNSAICSLVLAMGTKVTELVVFHPTYAGTIIFSSMLFYMYCSLTPDDKLPQRAKTIITIFLTLGLLCLRSKYYGIYILSLFFLYAYRPGIMRHFSVKHAVGLIILIGIIFTAAWQKIDFYFISGNADSFDPTLVESFARPVLYVTGGLILFDYFPFGTGLASFASYGSSEWYSNVYYEYGINNVHGLSPKADFNFICDAFYPSLAQFGVVGLILFICFWIYTYNMFRHVIRIDYSRYKNLLTIGALIICFILIECIAGNTFTQVVGMISMCLFGIAAADASRATAAAKNDTVLISPSTPTNPMLRKI